MRGLLVQLQVVHALLLREVKTRFGAHKMGYLWALIEPILWVATFAAMYVLLGRLNPPGIDPVPFLVTGILPFVLFRETAARTLTAIEANKGLLFYPQVRPLDLVLARAILELATHLVVITLLLGGVALWDGNLPHGQPLLLLAGLVLASGLGTSLGLVFCGLSTFSNTVERIFSPLLRPLFWTSAVFFPSSSLPTAARDLLLYNPVLHVVELVRSGYSAGYDARHVNAWYPAVWVIALLFFGLSLERVARRRVQLS